jgi:hypothetical protein
MLDARLVIASVVMRQRLSGLGECSVSTKAALCDDGGGAQLAAELDETEQQSMDGGGRRLAAPMRDERQPASGKRCGGPPGSARESPRPGEQRVRFALLVVGAVGDVAESVPRVEGACAVVALEGPTTAARPGDEAWPLRAKPTPCSAAGHRDARRGARPGRRSAPGMRPAVACAAPRARRIPRPRARRSSRESPRRCASSAATASPPVAPP